ncbi:MAG TPA: 50S ribosomal protein L35 [Gaiellaceae bacterium]
MPKQKRHSGAKKRFRVTGTGKLLRRKAMKSHLLGKKSAKRKRSFRQQHDLHGSDAREVKRLLGGGR